MLASTFILCYLDLGGKETYSFPFSGSDGKESA